MKARTLRLITALFSTLLCFSTQLSFSQTPKYIIGAGEYDCYIIPTATQKVYDVAGGVPFLVPGQPAVVTTVAAALHHACLLDNGGNVYCWGDDAYGEIGNGTIGGSVGSAVKIATDSLGNPFNNIVQVCPGASAAGYLTVALKGDGTVWMWGATATGNRGNGTEGGSSTRPVQIPFPAGTVIKKIQMDLIGAALDQNGQVWTWGGNIGYSMPYMLSQGLGNPNYTIPTKINIPSTVTDIEMGSSFGYALCSNGDLYGMGYYPNLMGMGATAGALLVPTRLNSILNLPQPIKQIAVNNEASFALLTDGTIWAWGDNACGAVGNGQELNWATYVNSSGQAAPYAWDWGQAELLVPKPVHIMAGLNNFTNIWTGLGDVFYTYAEDANGNLYSWGRNKGGVLGTGEVNATGDILSIYPNSWDVAWPTKVNPLALTKASITSSPYCVLNPSGSPCSEYSIPNVANPTSNAGTNQNITTSTTTLTGSATTANANTFINYYLWTQVSGPSTSLITLPSGPVANVSNLVSGTYVFQLKVTDNNWRTATSQVTVVVNASGTNIPPVAKPNANITITLPTNSVTLDGTASSDPDGTIASYAWQQSTGPNSATIATPAGSTTNVTGLVAGTYTFSLTVTDNQGATNTAPVTVTVNPAVVQTPPTVSAGSGQTITLPVSTVTLTGTATGTNGATISSTSWSQVSGPGTATIVSVGNLVTIVNALVQGTYSFRFSATDNNGQTASSTVTVTVNATAPAPPPTVGAGSAQTITLPANSVTLTGTATGNGGATISSTSWTQTGGPSSASIGAAGSLSTSASNLVQGSYTFTLTATDSKGQTASANVTITVNPAAAVPPTASAGSAQTVTLPTNSTTLTGTATGNGGATISTTSWTQTGGPSTATIGTPAALSTTVSNLVAGTYTFLLSATDNNGQTASSTVTVTVNPAPAVPPTVSAGSAQTITLPTNSATLTGTAAGNGGATISSTSWTETGGPSAATVGTATALSTQVSNLIAGTYTFVLTATDSKGQTATASVTVTVNSSGPPPTFTPPTVTAGSAQTITLPTNSVTLTGTATGNGGATIASTQWTQIGGPAAATIGSGSSLSTPASNLVQGVYVFLLNATDNNGQSAAAYVSVTVNAAPVVAPTVTAGSAQTITLPANSVSLTSTATGNGGATIASTRWSQISGPTTATIGSATSLTTTVSNLVQGVYVFMLSAQDNNGQTGSAFVTVTVNAAPVTPPTVSAGSAQTITLPVNSTTLTGTATGTGGATITSTQWTQIGGPAAATFGSASSPGTTVSGLVQGVYVFLFSAGDNNGQSASAYVTVTVNAAVSTVTPPTVTAASQDATLTPPVNSTVLNGTATGTNGATIVSVQWTQVSGPTIGVFGTPKVLSTTISSLWYAGDYVFQLMATDNNGQLSSATVTVKVLPAPPVPTVNAGSNLTITLPTVTGSLTGTAAANGGASLVSTQWTFVSGPTTPIFGTPNALTTTFGNLWYAGDYVFKLTATDNVGQTASATVTVTVVQPAVNIPPIANPGANQTFTLTGTDTTISLNGSASFDPDGTIVSYSWYQLSGKGGVTIANSNTAVPTIYGLQSGVYVFVLVVTDNRGATAQAQVTVTINSNNNGSPVSALVANAGKDTAIALPANVVQLNGTGSSDAGGTIVSYQWKQVGGPEGMLFATPDEAVTQANNLVAGLYQFRLTVTDQAGDTASAVVKVTVMSDTRTSKDTTVEKFFLYPNPAHDQTMLTMTGDGEGMVVLHLFDLNGKFIKALQFSKIPGTSSVTIDVSRLTAGMYIIQAIYGNGQTQQIKLMKQ
jgi:alpha-tubulin suppressor-like RCC1 family protein